MQASEPLFEGVHEFMQKHLEARADEDEGKFWLNKDQDTSSILEENHEF